MEVPGCRHPVAGGAGDGLRVPVGGRGQKAEDFRTLGFGGGKGTGGGQKGGELGWVRRQTNCPHKPPNKKPQKYSDARILRPE